MSQLNPTPDIIEFTARMSAVHPELHHPVTWVGFSSIAQRCGIAVRVLELVQPARLLRAGNYVGIQIKRGMHRTLQTRYGMHEMWHFWNDDIRESCIYADDETVRHPREDAADMFAWYVTSPARVFLEPRRPLDLRLARDIVPDLSPLHVQGDGSYPISAVGVSFYQDTLEAIVGRRAPHGWELKVAAALACENKNPHDPKAVRVDIYGKKVGYLSRARARNHRQRYGQRTVHCNALIIGGWEREDGTSGHFGVRLDLTNTGEQQ